MTSGAALRRLLAPVPIAAALLLLAALLPDRDLLTGRAMPFYRDLGTTQLPARALAASLGSASLNPHASFGQPYRGNPNLVLAYPFPRAPRFLGLHLILHVLAAGAGAFFLLRRLVRTPEAALLGAIAFGFSGYVLSSTAFLNATTTIAWMPWLLGFVALARGAEGRSLLRCAFGVTLTASLLVLGGEPALATLALLVALVFAFASPREARARTLGVLGAGVAGALLVLLPFLLEVFRASSFSTRRVQGFSWQEFAAVGFHPLRFLETPFPLLFGDPGRLVSGGFWGFSVTQGSPPYLASLGFGVIPLTLALLFVISARRNEGLFWILLAAASLLTALIPWIPGAKAAYEALPFLHVVRYPGKAMLAFTLSVSALAALATDRLLLLGALPRFRRRASLVLAALAGLLAAASLVLRLRSDLAFGLLMRLWNRGWAGDPAVVLEPVLRRLPVQAALSAAALLLVAILMRKTAEDFRGRLVLLVAAGIELLLPARALIPRLPASWLARPFPLVAHAAAIPGRVYERTGKDLDPVRRGLFGSAPAEGVLSVGLAQLRQGWALTGAPWGLKYAFDPDPDGSYTVLNRMATDVVNGRDWPLKLKWLRSAGVGSVIASDVPPGIAGLAPVFVDGEAGIPAGLFRLTDPLPGVRRCPTVLPAESPPEAVALFESPDLDPATGVVVFGRNVASLAAKRADPSARVRIVADSPDEVVVETSGATPAVLHVDRSYTPRVAAAVDQRPVAPVVANLHLIGVPVPAGTSLVVIELAK